MPSLEWIGLKLDDLTRFYVKNEANFLFELNKYDLQIANSLINKFKPLEEFELIDQVNGRVVYLFFRSEK